MSLLGSFLKDIIYLPLLQDNPTSLDSLLYFKINWSNMTIDRIVIY